MTIEPFKAPDPIQPGTPEEEFQRQRHKFHKLPFDLKKFNAMRGYNAFKGWHHRQLRNRDDEWLAAAKAGDVFPYATAIARKRRIFDGEKLIWIDDPHASGEEPWEDVSEDEGEGERSLALVWQKPAMGKKHDGQ